MSSASYTEPRQSRADISELFVRWQQDRDARAREELVRTFMPLARNLARRYARTSEPLDDLLQVASVGLLHAIERFDPQRGCSFRAFAVPTILGEMRRYFRDCCWAVHVPRGDQERALRVRDAQEAFTNEKGRAPTVTQLAQYLEIDVEQVLGALQARSGYDSLSLDAPHPEAEDGDVSYGDMLGQEDERYELIEMDSTVTAVLGRIPAREREILRLRFVEDLTQSEIASRMGISQMQISRLLRRSLHQLRVLACGGG
jgi:RNA polymerase sigma-B factor